MSYIRQKAIAGLKQGDSFAVSRTFTEQDTMVFAEISRDYNPVHFDDRFAKVKEFHGHWLMLAEGHLTRGRFAAMLRRIAMLPLPAS